MMYSKGTCIPLGGSHDSDLGNSGARDSTTIKRCQPHDSWMLIPAWSVHGIFSSKSKPDDGIGIGIDDGRNKSEDGPRKRKRRYGPNSTNGGGSERGNLEQLMSDEIRQCDVCARAILWTPCMEQRCFSSQDTTCLPNKAIAETLPRFMEQHISSTSPLPCSFCTGAQVGAKQWCGSLYCSRECQLHGEGGAKAKTANDDEKSKASATGDSCTSLPLPSILPPKLFFCKHRFSNGVDIEPGKEEHKEVRDLITEVADSISDIERRFQNICGYSDNVSDKNMQPLGAEECAVLLITIISCTIPSWIRDMLQCTTEREEIDTSLLSKQMHSDEEGLVEEMWAMSRSHCSLYVLLQKFNDSNKNPDEPDGHTTTTDTTFPSYLDFLQCYLDIKRSCLLRIEAPTHPLVSYATKTIISPRDLTESERDTALGLLECSWLSPKSMETKTGFEAHNCNASAESSNNSRDVQSAILRWRRAAHFAHWVSNPATALGAASKQMQPLFQKTYFVYSPWMFRQKSHSCSPTLALTMSEVTQQADGEDQQSPLESLAWLALHDVPTGELTISLLDSLEADVDSRSTELKRLLGHNFVCSCIRCQYELSLKEDAETGSSIDTLQLSRCQLKRLGDSAMQGRFDDATTLYNSILLTHPHDGDVLHARAASFLGRASSDSFADQGHCQGHFLEAQRLWKEAGALKECENHPEISVQVEKQRVYNTNLCEESDVEIKKEDGEQSNIDTIAFASHLNGKCFVTSDETPILTQKECQNAINIAEGYASKDGQDSGWTTSRHYAVPTTDIPLHELTELNPWFYQLWKETIRPLLRRQFELVSLPAPSTAPKSSYRDIFLHDVFLVRYDAARQRYLPPHYDESTHSFIIALNSDFKGGGTYIHALNKTLTPKVGGILSFCGGELLHSGDPVVEGTRYIIAAFCYVDLVGGRRVADCSSHCINPAGDKMSSSKSETADSSGKEESQSPFSFGFTFD